MSRLLTRRALIAVLACSGCGADAAPGIVVRDSAGVSIIDYAPTGSEPTWTLAPPSVALGGMDGEEAAELYQPLHALRLEDGRIVVANQGTEELRFFGSDGRHLRTVGRAGGGPGEFRSLWGLARLPGDSLAAWDWTAKRLTLYDADGELGRIVSSSGIGGFAPRLLGPLEDGSLAVAQGFDPALAFASGGGIRDDSLSVLRLDAATGAIVDTLGPFPAGRTFLHMGSGAFWRMQIPFDREENIVVGGGTLLVGDDRTGELRRYDSGGALRQILRLSVPQRPVTSADVEAYRAAMLDDEDEDRRPRTRERLEMLPSAETHPAFTGVFVDRLGRTWVELSRGRPATADRWLVFDADGTPAGALDLPVDARPLDAGPGYVLLYLRDELDVEHVLLHEITTPETQP